MPNKNKYMGKVLPLEELLSKRSKVHLADFGRPWRRRRRRRRTYRMNESEWVEG